MALNSSQYTNKRREDRKTEVGAEHEGEKGGECEEDILPVGGKSEEVEDLKKYHKMF
jgi:hypothetical protein